MNIVIIFSNSVVVLIDCYYNHYIKNKLYLQIILMYKKCVVFKIFTTFQDKQIRQNTQTAIYLPLSQLYSIG